MAVDALQTSGAGVQPDAGIRDGDTVILDVNGEKQAFVTVKRNRSERTRFSRKSAVVVYADLTWFCAQLQQSESRQTPVLLTALHRSALWQYVPSVPGHLRACQNQEVGHWTSISSSVPITSHYFCVCLLILCLLSHMLWVCKPPTPAALA